MLLAILMTSGAILTTTSILALLMLYQLKQSNDAVSSTEAIFAADTGIEWQSCLLFKSSAECPTPILENATFTIEVASSSNSITIYSKGYASGLACKNNLSQCRSLRFLKSVFMY